MDKTRSLISGLAVAAWLMAGALHAQTSDSVQLPAGATVRITLQKPLDSKKNKPGDPVIAKSVESVKANGHDVLLKGAKIIGHLSAVEPHTKEKPQAILGIVLDRAILKNGRSPRVASPDPNAGTPGRIASPETPTVDNMTSRGDLTPTCRGVLRMEGLALVPEDPTLGSVIVSRNRNIQLDIGTQMMLRVPEQ